jgi:hypothetical protein
VLGSLVASELSSVVFVADYVQLVFWLPGEAGCPTPSCYVWPSVTVGEQPIGIADEGYRDAICSLIGRRVVAADEASGSGLSLVFDQGSIVLRPTAEDLRGPEVAMLTGVADGRWMVWRPGEEAFDYLA